MGTKAIEKVFTEFWRILKPLRIAIEEEAIDAYLQRFSWWPEAIDPTTLSFPSFEGIQSVLDAENFSGDVDLYLDLFLDLKGIVESLSSLPDVGKQLFEEMLYQYLDDYHPALLAFLKMFEVVTETEVPVPELYYSYTVKGFHWNQLGQIFNPGELVRRVYEWGGDFDHGNFLKDLQEFAIGFNVPAGMMNLPYEITRKLYYPNAGPNDEVDESIWASIRGLHIPFLFLPTEEGLIEAGVWVLPKPSAGNSSYEGVVILPYGELEQEQLFQLSETFRLIFGVNASGNTGLALTPTGINSLFTDGDLGFSIDLIQERSGSRLYAIGTEKSSSLSYRSFSAQIRGSEDDFGFGFSLDNGIVRVQGGEGDGFIQSILPKDPFEISFDIGFGWSLKHGFYIRGGAGLDFSFPINKEFGPFIVNTIDLGLAFDGNARFAVGFSGGVSIGPVYATVGKMGALAKLSDDEPGVFGNTGFSLAFQPPSEIGISIDAGGVKGGGFLAIDPPQYFGILSLTFEETFDLTVMGLISTEMPGETSGFSMIFSILAQFQPIQIGFGFALNGVGGLIGIHRSMNETGLRRVFKDHSLDAILFPENPIRNVSRILNAIETVFPAQKDRHSFGFMGLISWGGFIVKGSVGILIEVGGPGKLALIGQISAELPDEDTALVSLHMDVLGFIDFGKQFLSIDTSIYDSRILIFSLSGDMALRLSYHPSHADFGLAIGGFFPGYRPKMQFPVMRRMLVKLGNDFATVEFKSYFALTTNSVQIGANLYLKAGWDSVGVEGRAGFDALIQFSPFSFEARFYFYVRVKFLGASIASIDLNTTLTGPNPFHAYGYAKISLFFFSVKVDFDATFGKSRPEVTTEISPLNLLRKEAEDPRNIQYAQPNWSTQDVILKEEALEQKFLDPAGAIIFSQKSVPLQLEMERFAHTPPPGNERYLDISVESENEVPVMGKFAPAQFFEWTDKQKIQAPAFESFTSGKRWDSSFAIGSGSELMPLYFEEIIWEKVSRESLEWDEWVALIYASRENLETNLALPFDDELKQNLTLQNASQRFQPGSSQANPNHKNFISVKDEMFVPINDEAQGGIFTEESPPMTYTEAEQWAMKRGQKSPTILGGYSTRDDAHEARSSRRTRENRIPAGSLEG